MDNEWPGSKLPGRGSGEIEHHIRHGVLGVGQVVETRRVPVKIDLVILEFPSLEGGIFPQEAGQSATKARKPRLGSVVEVNHLGQE